VGPIAAMNWERGGSEGDRQHICAGERRFALPAFSDLRELLSLLRRREEGQTMAEYGIVLAVVTIAAVGVFTALSGGIQSAVSKVTNLL
jgi:Flp pilus assembly pilin Flp